MIKTFQSASMLAFALAAAILVSMASPADAQSTRIEFKVFKVGLIFGVGGGSGTLIYQGRRYPLNVGGVSLGATIGVTQASLAGQVLGLNNVNDIAGIYTATSAGYAVIAGGKTATLTNSNGVVLKVKGLQVGLAISLDLSGLSISLK